VTTLFNLRCERHTLRFGVEVWTLSRQELTCGYASRSYSRRRQEPHRRNSARHGSGIAHFVTSYTFFLILSLYCLRCCAALLQLSIMVVLVDLDDEPASPHVPRAPGFICDVKSVVYRSLAPTAAEDDDSASGLNERPNPNINGFSAALSCYP
jgi:hypothetical protein